MDLQALTERGFADWQELDKAGIKKKFELGRNEFGFNERVIIDNNLNQWDYIPEDNMYELRTKGPETQYINLL